MVLWPFLSYGFFPLNIFIYIQARRINTAKQQIVPITLCSGRDGAVLCVSVCVRVCVQIVSTARRKASAVFDVVPCPSVRQSQSGIASK